MYLLPVISTQMQMMQDVIKVVVLRLLSISYTAHRNHTYQDQVVSQHSPCPYQ